MHMAAIYTDRLFSRKMLPTRHLQTQLLDRAYTAVSVHSFFNKSAGQLNLIELVTQRTALRTIKAARSIVTPSRNGPVILTVFFSRFHCPM